MRANDISMREDATHRSTIDAQLADGWFNSWQQPIYAAIANCSVTVRDDPRPSVRMGAMVPTMLTASQHETRFGPSECELRGMLLGLETAGFTPRTIAVGDAPDGRAIFDWGSVWVEHADVVDPMSARYTNSMLNLARDVKDDIDDDADANASLSGHHLEIRFGACPAKCQLGQLRAALVEFMRSDARSIPERAYVKLGRPHILKELIATAYRAPWPHGKSGAPPFILGISAAAHSFDPLSLAPIAQRRLDVKRKLAVRYNVAPIWLVMTVTDLRGVWDESMAILQAQTGLAITPYDRVIVTDSGRAIIWDADGTCRVINLRSAL